MLPPKKQRSLGQEDGDVVGSPLVRGLPYVGADEHRLYPEYALSHGSAAVQIQINGGKYMSYTQIHTSSGKCMAYTQIQMTVILE